PPTRTTSVGLGRARTGAAREPGGAGDLPGACPVPAGAARRSLVVNDDSIDRRVLAQALGQLERGSPRGSASHSIRAAFAPCPRPCRRIVRAPRHHGAREAAGVSRWSPARVADLEPR